MTLWMQQMLRTVVFRSSPDTCTHMSPYTAGSHHGYFLYASGLIPTGPVYLFYTILFKCFEVVEVKLFLNLLPQASWKLYIQQKSLFFFFILIAVALVQAFIICHVKYIIFYVAFIFISIFSLPVIYIADWCSLNTHNTLSFNNNKQSLTQFSEYHCH